MDVGGVNAEAVRAWLEARHNEDAEAARKAASLCGCHPPAPVWLFGDGATDGRIVIADDPHPDVRRKLSRRWSSTYDGLFAAQHIVRHDPARVEREIAAKRRRLERHRPLMDGLACAHCENHGLWPCPDIVDDAQAYADEVGFPAELRLS